MAKATETDTYFPPTEQGVKTAITNGVEEKWAKLGFDIFDSQCGTLVRRLFYAYEAEKGRKTVPSHEACAKHAEELGLCKIIPISKLPKYLPDSMKKYYWVDTPENRITIREYFNYLMVKN